MMSLRLWKILSLWIMICITLAVSKTWEQVDGPFGGLASCITQCKGSLFADSTAGGVFRSDDNGESWYHLDISDNMSMTAPVAKGDTLFAGTRNAGLFMSPDLGKSWINVFPGDSPERREINTIKVIDNVLYTGSYMSVLRSDDNGKTWVRINEQPGFPTFYFCKNFTTAGNYYFACSSQGNGVIRSDDKGTTWQIVNNGLFDSKVYSLAAIDSVIFAGTYWNNVFRSKEYLVQMGVLIALLLMVMLFIQAAIDQVYTGPSTTAKPGMNLCSNFPMLKRLQYGMESYSQELTGVEYFIHRTAQKHGMY